MEEMREIVDIRTVDVAIKVGGGAWFALCLIFGLFLSAFRAAGLGPLFRGAYLALIGPLIIGLWLLYSWMTRYDPRTGYYGLDKLWVLAANATLFVAVGAIYGYLGGKLWARGGPSAEKASETASTNQGPAGV